MSSRRTPLVSVSPLETMIHSKQHNNSSRHARIHNFSTAQEKDVVAMHGGLSQHDLAAANILQSGFVLLMMKIANGSANTDTYTRAMALMCV